MKRNVLFYLLIISIVLVCIMQAVSFADTSDTGTITYFQFLDKVKAKEVEAITITCGTTIDGFLKSGNYFHCRIPYQDPNLISLLYNHKISVVYKEQDNSPFKARPPKTLWRVFIPFIVIFLIIIPLSIYMQKKNPFNKHLVEINSKLERLIQLFEKHK